MPTERDSTGYPHSPLPPIAVGGVGGSGTRLVAQLISGLGVHLGDDLNQASDLLWFTLLFKREEILDCDDVEFDALVHALVAGLQGGAPLSAETHALLGTLSARSRTQHPASWLQARADLLRNAASRPRYRGPWGWKEPNTHMVIERLWQRLPELRYVHVVRHGVDMAFSDNQNQLALWGQRVIGSGGDLSPQRSLQYWCEVHRRLQGLLAANPMRMYWLDYDEFCSAPEREFARLARFLELPEAMAPDLSVVRGPTAPRHATQDLSSFEAADLDYVASLGYQIIRQAGGCNTCETTDRGGME